MGCTNLCLRIKVRQSCRKSDYVEGKKYCSKCGCYFIQQELNCKCCGIMLRTRAHYKHGRKKYRESLPRQITIYPLVKK